LVPADERENPELSMLRREVVALRARVAELQRAAARHEETEEAVGSSLAEREELVREAERFAHLGTWTWDLLTNRATWSDELYRILGLEPGSIVPSVEAFFAQVHPDDRAEAQAKLEQAIHDGVLPLIDCRVVRPDGSIRHTTHSSSMLFDAAGTTRRMVGGVLDRTEALAVETQLRGTLALLEEAQRFARLGSWRFDARKRELEWSLEFRRIAGLPLDVKPDVGLLLDRIVPEDRARFQASYDRVLQLSEGSKVDARLRRPDGELRHVRVEGFQVVTADGHVEVRGTLLDVTEQVRMREELAHAQKMEAIGRLAAGIAHDFNNLLTVVTANLELLGSRLGPAAELDDSRRALASATSLTRRLLTFGRKAQLSLKLLDPNELVGSTIALMQRLVGDEVRIETQLTADLPQILADPVEIERALVNLVVNARDAMPGGGVVRILTSVRQLEATKQVELSVEDEGQSIDEAARAHLFEPFYTTRSETGGTGLGLATVLGTAEQHGGTVRFMSRAGSGSIFTIVLPAMEPGRGAEPRMAAETCNVTPVVQKPQARSLELMLVDDEPMIADVTRRMLERHGHKVRVATKPQDAMRIWAEHGGTIDLLICDVVMAQMRGPQLVAKLRDGGDRPRVLFITGYSEEAVRSELNCPVLAKPFTLDALLHAIDEALR
jgi:two-component system, cell cycle sensor histidine kinase and response regulator CckA